MTDKEVMQMALDALTEAELDGNCEYGAKDALRTALAQPDVPETAFGEIKPVAWMYDWTTSDGEFIQDWTTSESETLRDTEPNIISNIRPLYTTPHRKEWVGLTHKEHMEIMTGTMTTSSRMAAVEAKLKEKNT